MRLRYRFLAVDVDGTLMDSRNTLPEANRAALRRAHEAGMTVCLCTGRNLTETQKVIDELDLDSDAGVFVFGAIVSRLPTGETLHRTTIPAPLASRLVAHFRGQGFPVLVLYDVTDAGIDYRVVAGERNVKAVERWIEIAPARIERIDEWAPAPYDPVRVTIIDDPDTILETLGSVRRAFPPAEVKSNSIYAPNYGLHVVECFAPEVNKWHGIMQLAGSLGVAESQIVAIGDDINDLEMVRNAGLGIAMGNAIEPIKAVARWHVPTHDDCGVAVAIDRILNGQR